MEERYFSLLDDADADPAVRVVVVTGAGTTFCPGLDTQRLSTAAGEGKLAPGARRPQTYPLGVRKPMIAAINGACAGIGLMQALNCDVRFAADTAKFTTAYAPRAPGRVRQLVAPAAPDRRRTRARPAAQRPGARCGRGQGARPRVARVPRRRGARRGTRIRAATSPPTARRARWRRSGARSTAICRARSRTPWCTRWR